MSIDIQPIGNFFQINFEGHVVNPTSHDYIPSHWLPLLNEVTSVSKSEFGNSLHSLYLRGSVARGTACDTFADLDVFALLYEQNLHWKPADWLNDYQNEWQKKFPFVKEIEVMCSSFYKDIKQVNPRLAMIIKTQSLLLEGPSIDDLISPFKPDKSMMLNYRWLVEDLKEFLSIKKPAPKDIQEIAKVLIRSGFELVMPQIGEYTTDLYPCYQSFGQYYPERRDQMEKVLYYYLNPTEPVLSFVALVTDLGRWMEKEIDERIL